MCRQLSVQAQQRSLTTRPMLRQPTSPPRKQPQPSRPPRASVAIASASWDRPQARRGPPNTWPPATGAKLSTHPRCTQADPGSHTRSVKARNWGPATPNGSPAPASSRASDELQRAGLLGGVVQRATEALGALADRSLPHLRSGSRVRGFVVLIVRRDGEDRIHHLLWRVPHGHVTAVGPGFDDRALGELVGVT